ncbi:hypothetical protein TREPR_2650 [Treponema primitia ZAS-2]|uniref:Outer membrane protein beta-barrel domain-containing protein n=1 Tax=Treponema primitia (strain ATCC BAA-887 / DSM 12427 / ZAS-2) TaxID=545694 RepID=F5YR83_TREPZ|nr:DUF3996 domain-containing protein [Treponema primitia]AEF85664.1 hypothetical protein TREPR_2650 [Treponema primitia ZAS-2]
MKKVLAIFIVGLCLSTAAVFAQHPEGTGIGIVGQYGLVGGGIGPALSLKLAPVPVYWSVNLKIDDDIFGIGLAGDYYFFDESLTGSSDFNLGWYLGAGIGAGISFGSWDGYMGDYNHFGFNAAARLPIGLSAVFVKKVEVFLGFVPALGFDYASVTYKPKVGSNSTDSDFDIDFDIGGEIGIRIWL